MRNILIIITLFSSSVLFGQDVETTSINNGFQAKEVNQVRYYPNPASESLTVVISNFTLKSPNITIYSLIGNIVKTEIENVELGKYKVNVENLPAGYYFFAINDKDLKYRKTYKFLKR